MNTDPKTTTIRALNDRFRQGLTGKRYMTQGIAALPLSDQTEIMRRVMTFDAFTPDNDPHGEHDFGGFEHGGERIFWKIDYYAPDMLHGSEDPADPAKTVRVLTVMLAGEW